MVYEWKQSRFNADPQKVGIELEGIEYKDARTVLEVARKKKKSELHKCFEWDDGVAAEEYRLVQSRLLLRMLVIVQDVDVGGEPKQIKVRAYESIHFASPEGDDDKSRKPMAYVPIKEVLNDPALASQIKARLDSKIEESEQIAESYTYLCPEFAFTRDKLIEARMSFR